MKYDLDFTLYLEPNSSTLSHTAEVSNSLTACLMQSITIMNDKCGIKQTFCLLQVFSIHIIVVHITAVFFNCDYYRLKREKEITKKTEHNKSNYPVHWINVDYHHIHIKPPSTAIILKVHVVHPVSSMWEMPPCYSIWASLKTCWKTD